MPITDSTATLTTAWTERSTVDFLSGTLATITEMITEVEDKLKRGTLSASTSPTSTAVQKWLIRAKEELMQTKSYTFSRRYAYATLDSGDHIIALPPDYNGGHVRVKDQTNDFMLVMVSPFDFDLKYPDISKESNDEPDFCCIKNMEMWIAPPVSGSTELELEYERSGSDNTTTDFSFLPEIERFRCCDYAIYESCESLENWEKAKWYRTKWEAGMVLSNKADTRRKWKNMGFQAKSDFQARALRLYQQ